MRWLLALALLPCWHAVAGTAADVARALRETEFDRDECYRVRDLTLVEEDIRIYLTDGYLIFSKPVAGRPVAAVFTTDTEGGDGEVMLLPPDRAERKSLSTYIQTPNMDEHIRTVLLLFTGNEHETLTSQMARNPFIKKMPDMGALLADRWNPVLHNLAESFQVRLTLDLLGIAPRRPAGRAVHRSEAGQLRRGVRPGQYGTDSGGADGDAQRAQLLRHVEQFSGSLDAIESGGAQARHRDIGVSHRSHGRVPTWR